MQCLKEYLLVYAEKSKMRPIEAPKRIQYIRDLFAPEDQLLREIRENLEATDLPIQIGAEEGKLLQFLIRITKPKKIVEIGTLAGYSTIWMARGLEDNGHIYTVEKQKINADQARKNFSNSEVADKITLIEGEAPEILTETAANGPFDMAFIDADKINYIEYLNWAEENVNKGGYIIGDNSFLFETVYEDKLPKDHDIRPTTHKAMKEFNKRLSDPNKYMSIMLPTKEGITIAQKLF